MNTDAFWQIIETTCHSDPTSAEEWDARITSRLEKLPADEIVAWNDIFDKLAQDAYRNDMWAAAYLINGGASDDGFYYFRCWLIGMGRIIYESAIADPDNLANVAKPSWMADGIDAEAEIYAAAHQAWMNVTGKTYDDEYPSRNESAELAGEDWDFDDDAEMAKRLPRLFQLYDDAENAG